MEILRTALVRALLRLLIIACISMDKSWPRAGGGVFPAPFRGAVPVRERCRGMFCPSVHQPDRRCAEFTESDFDEVLSMLSNSYPGSGAQRAQRSHVARRCMQPDCSHSSPCDQSDGNVSVQAELRTQFRSQLKIHRWRFAAKLVFFNLMHRSNCIRQ